MKWKEIRVDGLNNSEEYLKQLDNLSPDLAWTETKEETREARELISIKYLCQKHVIKRPFVRLVIIQRSNISALRLSSLIYTQFHRKFNQLSQCANEYSWNAIFHFIVSNPISR